MYLSYVALITLTVFTAHSSAQDVDYNDLPSQCQRVCAPVVSLTQQCDQQHNDDENGQLQCVCSANNATSTIPLCEACFAMYDSDGHDNDVHDLVTKCSFTTTSYSATATSGGAASNSASMSAMGTATSASGGTTSVSSSMTGSQSGTQPAAQSTGAAVHGAELKGVAGQVVGLWGVIGALIV